MLTCSHAIPWKHRPRWITFSPGYYLGYGVYPKAAAERVIALKELDGTNQITNDQTAFDYAVAVLDSPLGLLTGWVGCRTYKASWNGLNV